MKLTLQEVHTNYLMKKLFIKVNGAKVKNKAKVYRSGKTGLSMKVPGRTTKCTATAVKSSKTSMKANSPTTNSKEPEPIPEIMVPNTLASSKTTTRMVMVSTSKQTATFIVEIGKMGEQTAWASITSMIKEDSMASGRAAR